MSRYIDDVMENMFGAEIMGNVEYSDIEHFFGKGFNRGDCEGSCGIVWHNSMFEPYSEKSKKGYNILCGVNFKDTEEMLKILSGNAIVKIIYYISDKELKRPDVDQRQEKFAKKVVEALFGRKYMDELKKRFN